MISSPVPISRKPKTSMQDLAKKPLLTTAETGLVIGMSSQTVVNYCLREILPCSRVGVGRRLIAHSVLAEFMAAHGLENKEYTAAMLSSPYAPPPAATPPPAVATGTISSLTDVDTKTFDNDTGIPEYIDTLEEDQARMILLNIQNAFNDKSRGNAYRVRCIAEAIAQG